MRIGGVVEMRPYGCNRSVRVGRSLATPATVGVSALPADTGSLFVSGTVLGLAAYGLYRLTGTVIVPILGVGGLFYLIYTQLPHPR